jgi:hypothetical protein
MDRKSKIGLSLLLLFSVFVSLAVVNLPPPARAGNVVPTGSLTVARFSHTATLLPNNRVLIAGGMERNGVWLNSAELYDLASGRFTAADRMTSRRAGAMATLLPNGKVLIAGGSDGSGRSLSTTEIYDPLPNAFSQAGEMTAPRGHGIAILLKTGKVLIAGGNADGDNQQLATAELFDPATGTFSLTGAMHTPRAGFAAVRLNDGRVLVAGGISAGRSPNRRVEDTAEIYDPATGRFTITGNMAVPRYKLGSALLPNGKVLVVGGSDSRDWQGMYASTEIYDPASGRFMRGPEMRSSRFKIPAGVVTGKDGSIVIAGGAEQPEVYDPLRSVLVPVTGSLLDGFLFSTSTLLPDGRILLVGGYGMDPGAGAVRHAWIYEP